MYNIIWNVFIVLSENQADKYEIYGNVLLIPGLTKENEANYQCTVRDGDNQWTSEQFYLEYKGIYH
jgi:hypothetical protein